MRFGVCTGIENIGAAQGAGFDYIEANASGIAALDKKAFEEKTAVARDADIRCECFNVLFPPTITLIGNGASDWHGVAKHLHHTFGRVAALGGEVVVFGSGKSRAYPQGMDFFDAYRQLADVATKTGEIAGEYGLRIAIEPLNRAETNMICSVVEGAIFVAQLDSPHIGLLADGYHMFADGEPLSHIKKVGKFAHIHIAKKDGRLYPTIKDELLADFFAQLCEIGYDRRVSIEGRTDDFKADSEKALALIRELVHNSAK